MTYVAVVGVCSSSCRPWWSASLRRGPRRTGGGSPPSAVVGGSPYTCATTARPDRTRWSVAV